MKCNELQELLLQQGNNFLRGDKRIRGHLVTCRECQANFHALAMVLEPQDNFCDEYLLLMPIYVESQLAGEDVQNKYPGVWRHFQICSNRCSQAYDELYTLLLAERARQLMNPPVIPPMNLWFVKAKRNKPSAWVIESVRDLQGRVSAAITIHQEYISSILSPQLLAATRARQTGSTVLKESFPLVDELLGEDSEVMISIEIIKDKTPTESFRWHVKVSLAGPMPLTSKDVSLSCNQEERIISLDKQGEAYFMDIPLHWLVKDEGTELNRNWIVKLHNFIEE